MASARENSYAVIMAGGHGERFWPQSRMSNPKQLMHFLGNLTLIEQTVSRLTDIFPPERIVIITNLDYVAPMRSLLTSVVPENIIGEPAVKDTAPCLALAAAYIRKISSSTDPVMCVFPSDHVIGDNEAFGRLVLDSIEYAASSESSVAVGIKPSFPATGYGYIRLGNALPFEKGSTKFYECKAFTEKPDTATAEKFIADGDCRWNAGMFVFRIASLGKALSDHMPRILEFERALEAYYGGKTSPTLEELYDGVPRISIDYAIMEKIHSIVVAESTFPWEDVGSWTSMRNQIRPEEDGNVVRGLHVGIDTSDCIIAGSAKHLIATVDVKDAIIVHTDDATLVCSIKSAQRIKELVRKISERPELAGFL